MPIVTRIQRNKMFFMDTKKDVGASTVRLSLARTIRATKITSVNVLKNKSIFKPLWVFCVFHSDNT